MPIFASFILALQLRKKHVKNLSQGSRRFLVYMYYQNTYITIPTHTHIHTHITKQFKTTTLQMKTNTVQDIPKLNSHNIIKYPQYKVNGTFIHKNFTVTHFISLTLHFSTHFTSLHYSLQFTSLAVTDDWTDRNYLRHY